MTQRDKDSLLVFAFLAVLFIGTVAIHILKALNEAGL